MIDIDYSLYLVTDRSLITDQPLAECILAAIKGGVTCVQLREKNLSTREFVGEAKHLMKLLKPLNIPLIINDRIDVALACNADGVHLGQSDMTIQDARRIMNKNSIIGISAESYEDAIQAELDGADYIGVSPVFATSTKEDTAPPLGLEGLAIIRKDVSIPLVGIGGINTKNVAELIRHGVDGVAVISAIIGTTSPLQSAIKLSQIINMQKLKQ
ncbi:MAG: thiamine phosphate synthase [Desulfotalea sp.]